MVERFFNNIKYKIAVKNHRVMIFLIIVAIQLWMYLVYNDDIWTSCVYHHTQEVFLCYMVLSGSKKGIPHDRIRKNKPRYKQSIDQLLNFTKQKRNRYQRNYKMLTCLCRLLLKKNTMWFKLSCLIWRTKKWRYRVISPYLHYLYDVFFMPETYSFSTINCL